MLLLFCNIIIYSVRRICACFPPSWVLFQMPGSLRVLHSILVVPVLFNLGFVVGILKVWESINALNAPITLELPGTMVTFHICSSCSFRLWYFSVFSCSFFLMLPSAGSVTTFITAVFCFLSIISMSGWLASSCLSVWNMRPSSRCIQGCALFHSETKRQLSRCVLESHFISLCYKRCK